VSLVDRFKVSNEDILRLAPILDRQIDRHLTQPLHICLYLIVSAEQGEVPFFQPTLCTHDVKLVELVLLRAVFMHDLVCSELGDPTLAPACVTVALHAFYGHVPVGAGNETADTGGMVQVFLQIGHFWEY